MTFQDERFRTLAYGGFDTQDTVFYLYDIATQIKAKKMVEIGVGHWGCSTRALLFAARDLGSHLWSVDNDPCLWARETIEKWGLLKYWTFTQSDSREFLGAWSEGPVDFMFIDSGHTYPLTLEELRLSLRILSDEPKPLIAPCPHLRKPKAIILLHDTKKPSYTEDMMRSINEFLEETRRDEKLGKYIYVDLGTRHGLGLVIKF